MLPMPKSFQGLSAAQIDARMKDSYYTALPGVSGIYRDELDTHLIHVNNTPDLTEAFCIACRNNAGNPFLPQLLVHAPIGPDLHIAITENLRAASEFDAEAVTLSGHARAVAALFEGDDIHDQVHRFMVRDRNIVTAVSAIIDCGLAFGKAAISSDPSTILFRCDPQGGAQTVFARPLSGAGKDADQALEKLRWIEKRFSPAERSASSSPYWR